MATKKVFDKNIILILGFVIVLAGGVVLFRSCTKPKCPEVKFKIVNTEIKAGDEVFFKDETDGANEWAWDFNDSATSNIANPTHIFINPGEYTVWLYVNGCKDGDKAGHYEKITVAPAAIPELDSILTLIGGIKGPEKAYVDQVVSFKDTSTEATSWEWQFGESGMVDATTKEAKYMFKVTGPHTVTLVINGKSRTATHKIDIKTKPTGGGGKKSSVPAISEEQFITMLGEIIAQRAEGSDIFSPYTGGHNNQIISVNGKDKVFSTYCSGLYLSGSNKIIKSVKFNRDAEGYITGIVIIEANKPD